MKFDQLPITTDFSETAADEAARMLGAPLVDCHVYASDLWRVSARCLQGLIGFELTLIPLALLPEHPRAWAVAAHGRMAGSLGTEF